MPRGSPVSGGDQNLSQISDSMIKYITLSYIADKRYLHSLVICLVKIQKVIIECAQEDRLKKRKELKIGAKWKFLMMRELKRRTTATTSFLKRKIPK